MTKMVEINRANLETLGHAFVSELREIGDRYGVDIGYEGGRYGGTRGHVKIGVAIKDTSAAKDVAKTRFESMAPFYGLDPTDFGKTFLYLGRRYKIAGIRPNATKNAVMITRLPDGKGFVMPPATVKSLLSAGTSRAA